MMGDTIMGLAAVAAIVVTTLGLFAGVAVVVGVAMDKRAQYIEQHDRCLKHATNGLEIEKCR